MFITNKDQKIANQYQQANAKMLGNLHERMKHLLAMARIVYQRDGGMDNDLWQAIFDLELEVQFHQPAKPPFGKRFIKLKDIP